MPVLTYSLAVLLLAPNAEGEDLPSVHPGVEQVTTFTSEATRVAFTGLAGIPRQLNRLEPKTEHASPDTTALREARHQLVAVIRARDVQGLVDAFAPDGVMRLRSGHLLHGKEEIHAFWAERWRNAEGPNPLGEWPREIVFSGEYAFERGGYGPLEAGPTGDYVRVWRWDSAEGWRVGWLNLQ
ncbi:MAG: nuclear transport factor 2 family protein [Bacteroidota bacterium]